MIRGAAIALALLLGAWLVFDGGRALIAGDYVTPRTGEHAGQLGPWARVVSAVGIEPRSTLVKVLHVALGLGWLGASLALGLGWSGARGAILTLAVLSLWYLPFGTLIGLIEIGLMLAPSMRR